MVREVETAQQRIEAAKSEHPSGSEGGDCRAQGSGPDASGVSRHFMVGVGHAPFADFKNKTA
jgi:hypothetical protein